MKRYLLATALLIATAINVDAQIILPTGSKLKELPIVYLSENVTIHFISPEPIQYVDIPPKVMVGDLPLKNILRLKYATDSAGKYSLSPLHPDAVITVVGEKFLAQYRIIYRPYNPGYELQSNIEILPEFTLPLDVQAIGFSQRELKHYSLSLFSKNTHGHQAKSKAYGLTAKLNSLYTLDDYIFLDLGYQNETNLNFNIDQIRFKIDDRKVNKASTVQSIELKPAFVLFDTQNFKKRYRNVFVFKKFSFPDNKILKVEMSEKQISGRVSTLNIKYKDVLKADVIPTN